MQSVDHTKNIVEVEHVSFAYTNHEVLHDINLTIHRGDYLAIVGGNGSGKTTLLKIILGLLQPATGSVRLFGQAGKNFKDWWKVGYVPQKVTHFDSNFPGTVEEIVLMGRYARRGLFHRILAEDHTKARQALERVEMWEYRDRLIGDLSGGQQQRVFIARALAAEPEVVFFDEPTTSIDEAMRGDFYALLKKLNQELTLTVILITHDITGISHEAMHVACIDHTLFFHTSIESYLKSNHPEHIHYHA